MNVDEVEMGNLEMRWFLLFSPFTEPDLGGKGGGGWGLGAYPLQSAQACSPRQATDRICCLFRCCGQSYLLEIGLLGLVWLVWLVWLQGTKGTNQPLGPTPCRVVPRAALSRVHESGLHLRLRLQTATATCNLHTAHCTLHSHSYSTACPIQTTSPFQHPWAASPHRRIAAPRSYNIPGLSDIYLDASRPRGSIPNCAAAAPARSPRSSQSSPQHPSSLTAAASCRTRHLDAICARSE